MGDASKKSINHQFVSNGETSENENSELSQNFRTVNLKNKKLLKFRKDKNDINAQIRQYTSKNIPEFNKNIVRKDRIKSKTIKQTEINLTKSQKSSNKFFSLFKPEHFYDVKTINKFNKSKKNDKNDKNEKNDESHFSSRNSRKKNSFSIMIKGENNLFTSLREKNDTPLKLINLNHIENSNVQLPSLGFQTLQLTERHNDTNNSDVYKNIFKTINTNNAKLKTLEKENTLTKKESSNLISKIIKKPHMITKFHRKQTMNFDLNFKSNLISKKLLKKCKLNVKNNKFLKDLKGQVKHMDKAENIKKSIAKDEVETVKLFIENKINDWMLEYPLKEVFSDDKNLEFNENDKKRYFKKEQKFIHIIIIDFIKRMSSPINISLLYLKIHKGVIEKDILRYIREQFFDIIMPSCLFENNNCDLYLNKLPKKKLKNLLLRQKTSDNKKVQSKSKITNSIRENRRLSTIEQRQKFPLLDNFIPPLDEEGTRHIMNFYHLDMDIDGHNHNEHNEQEDNKNTNDEQYSFLSLLKEDLDKIEVQELLKNKFINIYMMRNGGQSEHVLYNKKKSIKNNMSNKCLITSTKNGKLSLFRNNFFSRNEVKYSKYKMETTKKKKSLLEYNLLFDPNLNGYNNLIADGKMASESNEENANIEKLKEIQRFKNNQLTSLLISSGGMKTDKNIYVMKTLDLKNQYNHKNKGNINSLTSSIKDCNYESFVKFYRACNCGPNAIDKDGNSLLSLAVKSSCLEIVNFLLDEKANPNLQNVSRYIYNIFLLIFI